MRKPDSYSTRKKFLQWGTVILASAAAFRFIPRPKKKKKDTVKMLTQDGRLVEVDKTLLASGNKKITDKELQHWVKNKTAQH
jgi:hypothetical protein